MKDTSFCVVVTHCVIVSLGMQGNIFECVPIPYQFGKNSERHVRFHSDIFQSVCMGGLGGISRSVTIIAWNNRRVVKFVISLQFDM